jgi:hypothetical protein
MSAEKSGYKIRVAFTPTGETKVEFDAKSKQRPTLTGDDKIDINTDGVGELKEFAPGDQYELGDATVTIIDDFDLIETLRGFMNDTGLLEFTSSYTDKIAGYPNSWIKEIAPGSVDLAGNPTTDITFSLGGGVTGVPTVTAVP